MFKFSLMMPGAKRRLAKEKEAERVSQAHNEYMREIRGIAVTILRINEREEDMRKATKLLEDSKKREENFMFDHALRKASPIRANPTRPPLVRTLPNTTDWIEKRRTRQSRMEDEVPLSPSINLGSIEPAPSTEQIIVTERAGSFDGGGASGDWSSPPDSPSSDASASPSSD